MADDGAGDRTEKATPKRREDARKKGQIVLSPEVSPVAVLLAALAVASWGAPEMVARSRLVLRAWLAAVGPVGSSDDSLWPLFSQTLHELGTLFAPFFLMVSVVGVGTVIAQVGFQVNPELLMPQLSRLGLASGAKRLFSAQGTANLVKAVVKIVVVLTIAYQVLWAFGQMAIVAPAMPLEDILTLSGAGIRKLLLVMVAPLAVLGAADWAFQRWQHERSLRMSRQEVKEEHKETEGNPQIRGRFRRAHREIAKRRMLNDVRDADVVLTNPTHVAVALRYRPEDMAAPKVLAKGADEMAARIKEAARKAGVPIVERRALARALFRTVQVGNEIPSTLYKAVAEILAYIYSLRGPAAREVR
jgi:flagellar biosynthesis protein FlhB